MASLSEKLRRERELRGISLKQISDDTKIGVRFLQALEEDKLELIPGEFYRRELPGLLAVLEKIEQPIDVMVIDGYVDLAPDRPGLGRHLWSATA